MSFLGLLVSEEEVTRKHRLAIVSFVGSKWRSLGYELGGFCNAQMDELEEKFKANLIPFEEMIYQLILKWEDQSEVKPTVAKLAQSLSKCALDSALISLASAVDK